MEKKSTCIITKENLSDADFKASLDRISCINEALSKLVQETLKIVKNTNNYNSSQMMIVYNFDKIISNDCAKELQKIYDLFIEVNKELQTLNVVRYSIDLKSIPAEVESQLKPIITYLKENKLIDHRTDKRIVVYAISLFLINYLHSGNPISLLPFALYITLTNKDRTYIKKAISWFKYKDRKSLISSEIADYFENCNISSKHNNLTRDFSINLIKSINQTKTSIDNNEPYDDLFDTIQEFWLSNKLDYTIENGYGTLHLSTDDKEISNISNNIYSMYFNVNSLKLTNYYLKIHTSIIQCITDHIQHCMKATIVDSINTKPQSQYINQRKMGHCRNLINKYFSQMSQDTFEKLLYAYIYKDDRYLSDVCFDIVDTLQNDPHYIDEAMTYMSYKIKNIALDKIQDPDDYFELESENDYSIDYINNGLDYFREHENKPTKVNANDLFESIKNTHNHCLYTFASDSARVIVDILKRSIINLGF